MDQKKTVPDDFHSMRYDSIQTLRGICALLVVMHHMRFFARGSFGVDIFFCISGFMIMLTTQGKKNLPARIRNKYFLRKRLIRVIPFYYLMTVFTFILLKFFPDMFQETQPSFEYLVKSLLFVPFDIGEGVLQPILRVGWTINYEVFFYLLFFLSLRISWRYRGWICTALLSVSVLIGAVISGGRTITGKSLLGLQPFFAHNAIQASQSVSPWLAPFFFYGCPIILEFALGILCYYIARFLYVKVKCAAYYNKASGFFALLTGIVLLLLLIITAPRVSLLGWRRPLVWGVPAMLTVLSFFIAGLFLKMPRFSVRLGDISFSIYLIHYYPVMFMDRKVFDFSSLSASSAAGALLTVALVLAISYPVWYLIEIRFTASLRKHLCG
ncbi:MAG: acyltransferase [Clostridiales bacterium]|nr:acyltransferase [Clostridiales bacterium]